MSGVSRATICECGDHAFRSLRRGYVLLVSPEDAGHLEDSWCASRSTGGDRRGVAVIRHVGPNSDRKTEVLARKIIGPSPGMQVDHRNNNGLDNRRPNLRECTPQQNSFNRRSPRVRVVPLKGVVKLPNGRFRASITASTKRHHLGVFDTPEDAHAAYRAAAERLHGEFARAE